VAAAPSLAHTKERRVGLNVVSKAHIKNVPAREAGDAGQELYIARGVGYHKYARVGRWEVVRNVTWGGPVTG
jgi:hypothetical protein